MERLILEALVLVLRTQATNLICNADATEGDKRLAGQCNAMVNRIEAALAEWDRPNKG